MKHAYDLVRKHTRRDELAQARFYLLQDDRESDFSKLITRYQTWKELEHFEQAESALDIMCPTESPPDSPTLLLSRGRLAFERRDYQAAESWYHRAHDVLTTKQDSFLAISTPLILLGSSVARQGRLSEAIEIYRHACELPNDGHNDIDEAWANVGFSFRALGELEASLEAFIKAAELGYEVDNQIDDVNAALAMKKNPGHLDCSDYSRFYDATNMAQALVCAEHLIAKDPHSHINIGNYAQVLTLLRRFDNAAMQIQRLESAEVVEQKKRFQERMSRKFPAMPTFPALKSLKEDALCHRSELASCSGNLSHAVQLYQQATALLPNAVYLRNDMGWVYLKLGQLGKSLTSFQKALELIDKNYVGDESEAHDGLGRIHRMIGNYAKAAKHFSIAAKLTPDSKYLGHWAKDAQIATELSSIA